MESSSTPNLVRIHAAIADGQGAAKLSGFSRGWSAIALWYYVRGLDRNGAGWADLNIQEAATNLNKSPETIRRYIRNGKVRSVQHRGQTPGELSFTNEGADLFRAVRWHDRSNCRIYYQGLFAVARSLNLQNWGATIEVPISDLADWSRVKARSVEAELCRLQDGSRFHAERDVENRRPTVNPSRVCNSSYHVRGAHAILYIGKRSVFVQRDFSVYGVSQRTVAERLSRSKTTIERRLSNSTRQALGLDPIERRQVLKETDVDPFLFSIAKQDGAEFNRPFYRSKYKTFDRVYRAFPSIYDVDSGDLLSMRSCRFNYRRHLRLLGIAVTEDRRKMPASMR